MKFGVIYTVDIIGDYLDPSFRPDCKLSDWEPRNFVPGRGLWKKTETTKGYEDQFGDDIPCCGHGKWLALLTKEQIKKLMYLAGFTARSMCDTAGALGMPGGCWYGWSPAWSFDAQSQDALVNMFVTPWPEIKKSSGVSDRELNWNRIKKAMTCLFKD